MTAGVTDAAGRGLIISVHVPKTAGTSLITEIKRGSLGCYLLDYDDRPTSMRMGYRLRRLRSRLRARLQGTGLAQRYDVIHGHFLAEKYAFLYPKARFISFLREPISRLLSHYYYFKDTASKNPVTVSRNPDIALVASGELGLLEFARSEAMQRMYAHFLGGLPLEQFALIGITERYAESVAMLNGLLGSSLEVRHERRSGYERYQAEYEPLMPELEAANRENARIYAEALRIFEKRLKAG